MERSVQLQDGRQFNVVVFDFAAQLLSLLHTNIETNPRTEDEPQQIVAQRLLSCLQYHVPIKSSTEDLTRPAFCITVNYRVDQGYQNSNTGQGEYRRCQHGF